MEIMKHFFSGLTVLSALILTACGGGGGGGASNNSNADETRFGGKGVIRNADVLVCRMRPSGNRLVIEPEANCYTTSTAANGSYRVNMPDGWTGPIMVKIRPKANNTSEMLNEVTGVFEPYTFELKGVSTSASNPPHVTPFSDMAATAVANDPNLTFESIPTAIAMVQQNLGVDLSVKPVLDASTLESNGTEAGKQLGLVVALTKIVKASDSLRGTCPMSKTAIECAVLAMQNAVSTPTSLNASAKTVFSSIASQTVTNLTVPVLDPNGVIRPANISNVSDSSQLSASLQSVLGAGTVTSGVVDQIRTTVEAAKTAQNLKVSELNQASIGNDGKIAFVPPSTTFLSATNQAKTLVNQVRDTFNYYVNDSKTGILDLQKNRIENNIQNVLMSNTDILAARVRALNLAAVLYDEFTASTGNYQVSSDANGTFYYKSIGQPFDLSSSVWGGFKTHIICRTNSNPSGNTIAKIYCSQANNLSLQWIDSNRATVRALRWIITPVDANQFTYVAQPHLANVYGNRPYVSFVNYSSTTTGSYNNGAVQLSPATPLSGPFNLSANGTNTVNPACLSSVIAPSVTTSSDLTWTTGQCVAYRGQGNMTRAYASGATNMLSALTFSGTLPSSLSGSEAVAQKGLSHDEVNISMSRSALSAPNTFRYVLSGSVVSNQPVLNSDQSIAAYTGAQSRIELPVATRNDFSDGTYLEDTEVTDSNTGEMTVTPVRINLRVRLTQNQTALDGTFGLSEFVTDRSGNCNEPTRVTFNGSMIDNSVNGIGSFVNLSVIGSKSGFANFNCSQAQSANNHTENNLTITGKLLSPQRPDLRLTLAGTQSYTTLNNTVGLTETISLDLSYNPGATSSDRFSFAGTVVRHPSVSGVQSFILTSHDGIKLNWIKNTDTKILSSSNEELGIWRSNGVIYFKDGSFVSL